MNAPAVVKNWSTNNLPSVSYAFGIVGPNTEDLDVALPVCRIDGTYEELRAAMHRDIDMMFDAHLDPNYFEDKK